MIDIVFTEQMMTHFSGKKKKVINCFQKLFHHVVFFSVVVYIHPV